MKKTIFLLFAISMLLTITAFAQDPESSRMARERSAKQRLKTAALEAILELSPAAKALRGKVNVSMGDLIAEATKTGDPALKPHLKVLAVERESRISIGSAGSQAHIALAKLGDMEAFSEILAELNDDEIWVQDTAIAKLARIGGKQAYRKLYELLDDMTNRDKSVDDLIIRPKAFMVMRQLGEIIENPPRLPNGLINDLEVAPWKAWFAKNKHLIE